MNTAHGKGWRPQLTMAQWRWLRPALWLLVLGPMFFLLYGGANHYAASLPAHAVASVAWAWERHIPLVPWTIVPYWSIDLMFALSLFLCREGAEVRVQGLRLALTTAVSCLFFVLFPLYFSFERPPVEGLFGVMFTALEGFDKPYNQAPSLHIGLLVVIWSCFRRFLPQRAHRWVDGWCLLIAVSVLTTWQHHVLDVPTGAALGFVVLYLLPWPERAPVRGWKAGDAAAARRLARRYGVTALLLLMSAVAVGGWSWLLLWPALGLALLAHAYGGGGPAVWQKQAGRYSSAARVLLAPVLLILRGVQGCYRRHLPPASLLLDDVHIGSLTAARDRRFAAVLDLSGEYERQAHAGAAYAQLPMLDLLPPNHQELEAGVALLQQLRCQHQGPVLVHCALGLTRSVCVGLAWLVHSGRAATFDEALQLLRRQRPQLVLSPAACTAVADFCRRSA